MPLSESITDFHERHGGQPVEVNGFLIYEDGARCEAGVMGGGAREEPPKDEYERLQIVRQYWDKLANVAARDFKDLKQILLKNARGAEAGQGAYRAPDERDIRRLKALQYKATAFQRLLDRTDARLAELAPPSVRLAEQMVAEYQKMASGRAEQIKAINI
jgi:hypothetical protein